MEKYIVTGWRTVGDELRPVQASFEEEKIEHPGDCDRIYELGESKLINRIKNESMGKRISNITLWHKTVVGNWNALYPRQKFD